MHIGIITFHAAFNYGSMLQAWALQTYLEKLGHEVEIVNYRSTIQRLTYHKPLAWCRWDVALASIKRLLLFPSSIRPLNEKWHLFDDFMHRQMHLSKEYSSVEELQEQAKGYDLLVCGSDQIWNTCAPDSGPAYYGNWFHGRKISYAASLNQPALVDLAFEREQIRGFDAISVREEASRRYLLDHHIATDVRVVCDPTLLLPASGYRPFVSDESLIKGDYIFLYCPVNIPYSSFRLAEKLSQQVGMPVVTEKAYYPKDLRRYPHIHRHIATGPREFLSLIRHARYVVGMSFHLLVFSILFHKNFYCVNGDKDSRTNNLLTKTSLLSRAVSLDADAIVPLPDISDWTEVDALLEKYIWESKRFLDDSLG